MTSLYWRKLEPWDLKPRRGEEKGDRGGRGRREERGGGDERMRRTFPSAPLAVFTRSLER